METTLDEAEFPILFSFIYFVSGILFFITLIQSVFIYDIELVSTLSEGLITAIISALYRPTQYNQTILLMIGSYQLIKSCYNRTRLNEKVTQTVEMQEKETQTE